MYAEFVGFFSDNNRERSIYALFWISGILSCFLDNVSYGLTLSATIKRLQYTFDISGSNLAYSMMLSQQLSCNCCIISSVTNLIVTNICSKRNSSNSITFISFIREGFIITLISFLIATGYLYVKIL